MVRLEAEGNVARDEDDSARPEVPADDAHEAVARAMIEADGRLVQEPDRSRDEGEPRQREAPLLPFREECCRMIRECREVESRERRFDVPSAQELLPEAEVLEGRQGGLDRVLMGNEARLLADAAVGIAALEIEAARCHLAQARD